MCWVVRTWKRDQSSNRMRLTTAVTNLVFKQPRYSRRVTADEYTERLLRGEVIDTPLATFHCPAARGEVDPPADC
jgi:hypothetical protein